MATKGRVKASDAAAYVRGKTAGAYGKKPRGTHPQYKRGYKIGQTEYKIWLKRQPKRAKPSSKGRSR